MAEIKDIPRELKANEDDKCNIDKNSKNNTLKNVKRKIRKTFQRKFSDEEKPKYNNAINDEKSDKVDINNEENIEKGKFTLKKIFRKSSFRKIIANIQQITNFTPNNAKNDRVPPLNNYVYLPADSIPGVMGIRNHGNTCFMNAVLQCLSHTDILAEYFVLDQYKADLRKRNKINSRKFGTKGELTEQLALVLKALWTCKDPSDYSTTFKDVVERYGSQFKNSTQHDAQEFLFWLLDKVHEDLNTATKRKYKIIKNNYGRSDEIVAAETLANYMRCNNSFVQAVFRAQFRSSLTCPRCHKQSNTFDPFHCVSVQLPQLTLQSVNVNVVYNVKTPKQVRMSLSVSQGSSVLALREQLHADTGIESKRMILTECTSSGFNRLFCDSHPLSNVKSDDTVYCIELPEKVEDSQVALCFVNVNVKESPSKRFGSLFCMKINRDVSFIELQKALLKEMSSVLKPETFSYSTPINEMFKLHLQEGSADPNTYLESKFEHPLLTDMVDLALSVHPSDSGPQHIKLSLEWTEPDKYFSDMEDNIVEHGSVKEEKEISPESSQLTLEHCLDHYTKAETLSTEDAWRCPNCQKYLPVVKTLGLWSLPDILVIHFKRFRQQQLKGSQVSKLTTMVKFPLTGFDMSTWHLANDGNHCNSNSSNNSNCGSLSRKSTKSASKSGTLTKTFLHEDHKYDLYAVCYHQGDTLETGHYTAACKNPYDQQWYKFDDQRVSHIKPEEVPEKIVNNEAYMLFYQRRKANENSDSSGASTSSGEHWVSKIVTAPPSTIPISTTTNDLKVEEINEISAEAEPIIIDTENGEESKQLEAILNLDDIKAIDSDDIPEVTSCSELINQASDGEIEDKIEITEHSIKVENNENSSISSISGNDDVDEKVKEENVNEVMVNGNHNNNNVDDYDEERIIEQKIEVKVEIYTSSPPSEKHHHNGFHKIDEEKEIIRNERDKIEDLMSQHKISNLLWNDQNNNTSNRHSDIGAIKISDLLLMDRIDDISSTSLPKNYMLHDTDRITAATATNKDYRIRGVSSCSKDTLLYIDQQSLLDDDSLLENRSHWISPVTPHKLITVSPKN
ncbi:unnamed protein product [Chironomus riparius]|uniref:ubiquitinyl hydrolase 1 n=1 Tax=Chironomus riparius TaxID=315576 RepID=A0A9N9WQ56_9DIPT|nr:unnamed protein product [Chironomus riparius]